MNIDIYEKDIRDEFKDIGERNKYVLRRMLYYIEKICQKYNLNYSILYGTLIGAVREKDVLPWDLDADIAMDEESYAIFLEKAQAELPSNLFLQNNKIDPLYCCDSSLSRIVDLDSELYPTSSRRLCPNGLHCDIGCHFASEEKINNRLKNDNLFFIVKKTIISFFICFGYFLTSLDFKRSFYQFFGYSAYLSYLTVFKEKQKILKKGIDDPFNTMDNEYIEFRDFKIRAPKQADRMLKHFYGDYMTRPSEEDINKQFIAINSKARFNKRNNFIIKLIYEKKFNK